MKNKFNTATFLRHLALTLLVAMLAAAFQTARAQDSYPEYITEVIVVGGSKTETNTAKETYEEKGYTFCNQDLNDGSGGAYIYLGYKKASRANTNGGYITDFKLMTYGSKQTNLSDVTVNGTTYTLCPVGGGTDFCNAHGDVNYGAGGAYIYLYYTKENFSDKRAVSGIKFISTGEKDPNNTNYVFYGNQNNSADFNQGADGPHIYMQLTTATKSNRPSNDPVMASGLTFNGDPQALLTINNSNTGTMMYRVGESGDFSSSIPTATNAGNYTVYYYAASNEFGNQSDEHYQTVSIAKSPNSNATVSIAATIVGKENVNPTVVNNLSTGTITYQYSKSSSNGFSTDKPNAPGTWYVKATIADDDNCNAYTTATKSFTFIDWEGSGTSSSPYLIKSTTDLDLLAQRVNANNNYQGTHFRVENDINFNPSSSTNNNFTVIGNYSNRFKGHFDGNGKTISGIRINSTNKYQGLFGYLGTNALVEKIKLANTIITGSDYIGGIAGENYGTIQNCTVESSVTINATYDIGGIVGYNGSIVSGCTSSVTLIGSSDMNGGITGYNTQNAQLEDNFVINAKIPAGTQYYGAIAGYSYENHLKNNFYRNCKVGDTEKATNVGIVSNNGRKDFTNNNGAVSIHTLTLCNDITTSTNPSITYDGTKYYAQGTVLTLSYTSGKHFLANNVKIDGTTYTMPKEDVTFTQYYFVNFNGGTLPSGTANPTIYTSGTLTLPTPTRDYYTFDGWYQGNTKKTSISGITDDITLTAKWTLTEYKITYNPNDGTLPDGTANPTTYTIASDEITLPTPTHNYYNFGGWYDNEDFDGDPITSIDPAATHADIELYAKWDLITEIYTTDDLIAFSNTVNAGNHYIGKTVTLKNNIDFNPTDETTDNFTAIGTGEHPFYGTFDGQGHTISGIRINTESSYQGLFGMNDGVIKNLTIDNAVITSSKDYVGGIAGWNKGTISNCEVTNDVKITSIYVCGGVVGENEGTISNCVVTNNVELTSNSMYCGGVAGFSNSNSSLRNNLVVGVTIIENDDYHGAIVGDTYGTLQNNFYYNTTVNGATTGVGCKGADIEDQNGAVPPDFIIDGDSETPVAITESNAGANVLYLRKLKKGVTSTIILPFDFDASSMDGIFYQLTSVNTDDWTAGANKVTGTLSANTPYLFLPNADIEKTVFTEVTLTPTTGSNSVTIDDNWTFHGVYEKILWETTPKNHYGFSGINKGDIAAGDFVKIGQYVFIKPTRAYLTYDDGISKSSIVLPDRIHVVFSDEEIASVIDPIDTPTDDPTEDITTPVSELPAQASNVKVWSYEKTIYIQAAPMTDYRIIDATGRVLRSSTTQTDRDEIRLGNLSGIVIVIINNKTYKINY